MVLTSGAFKTALPILNIMFENFLAQRSGL
jgi:hypothetical protein